MRSIVTRPAVSCDNVPHSSTMLAMSSPVAGTPSETDEKREKENAIAVAIDKLVHRILDIKHAARVFVPAAAQLYEKKLQEIVGDLQDSAEKLEDPDARARLRAATVVSDLARKVRRLSASQLPNVVENGLFLNLFASFDAFTGDLVRALYLNRPALFSGLPGTLPLENVLAAISLDELKKQVLDEEIEGLRRKSYVEQFAALAQRFDVKLTAFPKWAAFVEASQRRNLLTHCDGVVSDQYIRICKEQGVAPNELPALGAKLRLTAKYLFGTSDLLIEVGVKLGHTLWRKTIPTELEAADEHLKDLLYEAVTNKTYERAKMLGQFALMLPKLSSDVTRKMIIVNYAQALKRSGEETEMRRLLDSVDWSAALTEFRLAYAVLIGDFGRAAELMVAIGPKGQLISEESYHVWPLFLEYRETKDFEGAYMNLYGYPFFTKVKADAVASSAEAAHSIEAEKREDDSGANTGEEPKGEDGLMSAGG